jgi:hypothetical protein
VVEVKSHVLDVSVCFRSTFGEIRISIFSSREAEKQNSLLVSPRLNAPSLIYQFVAVCELEWQAYEGTTVICCGAKDFLCVNLS